MSQQETVRQERCHGITERRGAYTRCKHMTLRGRYCHQHLKTTKSLRITSRGGSRSKPYGLYTTGLIPKDGAIAQFTGDRIVGDNAGREFGNPFAIKIKKNPDTVIDAADTNTGEARYALPGTHDIRSAAKNSVLKYNAKSHVVNLIALRDIQSGEKIRCSRKVYGTKTLDVAPEPRKRRHIRELSSSESESNEKEPEPEPAKPPRHRVRIDESYEDNDALYEPKPKAPAKKPRAKPAPVAPEVHQNKADIRYEQDVITRLGTLHYLRNSPPVAEIMGIALFVKPKIAYIPLKAGQSVDKWHAQLGKALKEAEQSFMAYAQSGKAKLSPKNVLKLIDSMQAKRAKRYPYKQADYE